MRIALCMYISKQVSENVALGYLQVSDERRFGGIKKYILEAHFSSDFKPI